MNRGLSVVLLVAAVGCTNRRAAPPPAPPPPAVTVAKPVVKTVDQFTDLTGNLAAVQAVDLRARVNGYIQKVLFKDGDVVKAGDKLVQLDPAPYQVELDKAKADLKTAAAQLQLATANAARADKARGSISVEELQTALAQKEVAAANRLAAEAAVARAQLNLDYTSVEAPISGQVDRIYVTEGNLVTGGTSQGTVLTTIVSTDPIYAYFDVDEQTVLFYRRLIREGKFKSAREGGIPAEIQLKGEEGYPHKGTLDFISNRLNPGTGSLQIRGTFANPGPPWLMAPGMFVRGRIPLATRIDAILIPDEAVTTDQARKVVYVVGANNRVTVRQVELGPLSDGLRVVDKGLSPDDRIVIHGLMRVQPGAVVDPQPGEINPKSQAPNPKQEPDPKTPAKS
ncbi:MAG TPA: efflux RND transporter periplasmic adaptor subunit [Fimbriiglobus sp.]|nr:efflux RND transporter periplasmic adaptor subunit [Fimbriiglobus sp.]